jgi:type I restriction enzyme S subunit
VELRPDYKQTEVGAIPDDWEVSHLRAHLLQDATYGVVKAGTFQRVGVPMLRGGDITNGAISDDQPLITLEKNREYSRTILQERDVVIALVGYPGESAVVPSRLSGANISRAVGLLRPARTLLPEFLVCYLNSPSGRKEFLRPSAGSAQIVVNLRALNRLSLPLPSLPEQRAIAEVLSDLDALLDGLDRLITKKRDLKQATMQQLLIGQTRLPGFEGDWKPMRLDELAEIVSGGTPRTTEPAYWNGGIRWCTPTDITGSAGKYLGETERTISHLGLSSCGARLLPTGALLLCSRATIGELKIATEPVCTNQGFKSLVCLPGVSNEFLYYKLLTMKQQMVERAFGSTFLEISKANIAALEISTPPLPEQAAIATVLSDMDAELSALESRRNKTRALKQAMMQELITGRTRLL